MVMVYGLLSGALYALVAVSFLLPYLATRFFNLSHAALFTCGGYIAFWLLHALHWSFVASIALSCVLCGILGLLCENVIFRPIRRRTSGGLAPLLASLGLYVLIQNLISIFFGDDTKLMFKNASEPVLRIIDTPITKTHLSILGCTSLSLVGIWALLSLTRLGKSMVCMAQNAALAEAVGIKATVVWNWAFFIGSGLCGLAGILAGTDTALVPTMGLNVMMMSSIAVILGRKRGVLSVAISALLLAFAQRGGAYMLGAQWQDAIALVVLMSCILFMELPKHRLENVMGGGDA